MCSSTFGPARAPILRDMPDEEGRRCHRFWPSRRCARSRHAPDQCSPRRIGAAPRIRSGPNPLPPAVGRNCSMCSRIRSTEVSGRMSRRSDKALTRSARRRVCLADSSPETYRTACPPGSYIRRLAGAASTSRCQDRRRRARPCRAIHRRPARDRALRCRSADALLHRH